jgi:hypothetical protein
VLVLFLVLHAWQNGLVPTIGVLGIAGLHDIEECKLQRAMIIFEARCVLGFSTKLV